MRSKYAKKMIFSCVCSGWYVQQIDDDEEDDGHDGAAGQATYWCPKRMWLLRGRKPNFLKALTISNKVAYTTSLSLSGSSMSMPVNLLLILMVPLKSEKVEEDEGRSVREPVVDEGDEEGAGATLVLVVVVVVGEDDGRFLRPESDDEGLRRNRHQEVLLFGRQEDALEPSAERLVTWP